jgi:hypothetical protein
VKANNLPVVALATLATFGAGSSSCGGVQAERTITPPPSAMRRLTRTQYINAIHDLFGDDITVARGMEPDVRLEGLEAVGSSTATVSPRGVEQYEALAFDVATQLLGADPHRSAAVPCQPSGTMDADCARQFVTQTGRRVWRRPLTEDEITELVNVATQSAMTLGDFYQGLQYALAAMLESPNFVFRVEIGEADPDHAGQYRYDGYEVASRLAFFLWDGPPDDALLDAAAAGRLTTNDGVSEQVRRMLDSPRAHRGLRAFVTQWLGLQELDDLVKDPMIFTAASPDLGPAAREETLRDFEHIAFDLDADIRDILLTRDTFLDRKLASLYGVRAPSSDGFALASLPADQPRQGLLMQASVLTLYAHPVSTSPTLRGRFVRETLLCQTIPSPPVNVNTGIPEPSPELPTMRLRLQQHAGDPFCAMCHNTLDPIGLALENFDGLAQFRRTENGAMIDASGNLDGVTFADAGGLAQAVHDHRDFAPCIVRRLYSFATGHAIADGERTEVDFQTREFKDGGYRLRQLMTNIAISPQFRRAGGAQ